MSPACEWVWSDIVWEMPRFPSISAPAASLPASIFSRLVERLARYQGETYPFHLGDTHFLPPDMSRLERIAWQETVTPNHLYRYGTPSGDAELIDAIVQKVAAKNDLLVGPGCVQITAGATHAIFCAARALLDHGDEVLLLAPHWPLIRGHIMALGAKPIEVPFSSELAASAAAGGDLRTLIEPYITPRTAAIYLITPNNPDGKVMGERELAAIADVARKHDLWVLADEVYEEYTFDGRAHRSIATLPGMLERTLTVFSFSKSYGLAGLRVGYVVGPESLIASLRKLANHTIYNVPRAMQAAALAALRGGAPFLAAARADYQAARDATLARLTLPCGVPEGGSYVFVDFTPLLGPGQQAIHILERLAEEGILLAPGDAFGAKYGTFARLCYTAVPRSRLEAGLEKMAAVLPSVVRG